MTGTIFTIVVTIAMAVVYSYINRHGTISKSNIFATLLMVVFSLLMFYLENDWRKHSASIRYDSYLNFAIMGCGSYFIILFIREEGDDVGMIFAKFLGWLGLIASLLVVAGGRAYLKTHLDSF